MFDLKAKSPGGQRRTPSTAKMSQTVQKVATSRSTNNSLTTDRVNRSSIKEEVDHSQFNKFFRIKNGQETLEQILEQQLAQRAKTPVQFNTIPVEMLARAESKRRRIDKLVGKRWYQKKYELSDYQGHDTYSISEDDHACRLQGRTSFRLNNFIDMPPRIKSAYQTKLRKIVKVSHHIREEEPKAEGSEQTEEAEKAEPEKGEQRPVTWVTELVDDLCDSDQVIKEIYDQVVKEQTEAHEEEKEITVGNGSEQTEILNHVLRFKLEQASYNPRFTGMQKYINPCDETVR